MRGGTVFPRALISAAGAGIFAVMILGSCVNPMHETLGKIVGTYNQSDVGASPVFNTLTTSTTIYVQFSKIMNPDTLVLGGTLGKVAKPAWALNSTTNTYDYTQLFLSPLTTWPPGGLEDLTVACADTDGYASVQMSRTFGVLTDAIYVSAAGNDSNPGTPDLPLKTIALAEDRAETINLNFTSRVLTEIRVAQGTYAEQGIGHYDQLTLNGGWKADWSAQDPSAYPSIILASGAQDARCLLSAYNAAPGTCIKNMTFRFSGLNQEFIAIWLIDSSVEIDNVDIEIGSSTIATGIEAQGSGNARIENCQIRFDGAQNTAVGVAALLDNNRTLTLEKSVIVADGSNKLIGVLVNSCKATINANTIKAANIANGAFGVQLTAGADAIIRNNVIDVFASDPTNCDAIFCQFGSALAQNNTFAYQRYGVFSTMRSGLTLANNLFVLRPDSTVSDAAGFLEGTSDAAPLRFQNNRFSGSARAYTDAVDGYYPATDPGIALLESNLNLGNCPASGNTATTADESVFLDSNWDLLASAPSAITAAGLDLSASFTTDRAGRTRPSGVWSIGAFQKQ